MSEATGSLINRRIRYATPVIMGAACVTCHNAHPESPKHDWKIGDIRGIQAITVEQPIAANILSFKFLRSEEHTSELQSLMRITYAVFCLKQKQSNNKYIHRITP